MKFWKHIGSTTAIVEYRIEGVVASSCVDTVGRADYSDEGDWSALEHDLAAGYRSVSRGSEQYTTGLATRTAASEPQSDRVELSDSDEGDLRVLDHSPGGSVGTAVADLATSNPAWVVRGSLRADSAVTVVGDCTSAEVDAGGSRSGTDVESSVVTPSSRIPRVRGDSTVTVPGREQRLRVPKTARSVE